MAEERPTPTTPLGQDEPISRRALLKVGAAIGAAALFALTACGIGGGGGDEDEDEDDD